MLRRIAGAIFFSSIVFFAGAAQASDVAVTWDKAMVYAGGSRVSGGTAQLDASKPGGVMLFMHGCAGIGSANGDAQRWAALISKQGLIVVMPDSMARSDRKRSCDPVARKGGLFPPVHGMRLEEIRYASEQIRRQPWFDGKTFFLMGYSEGAIAAVRSQLQGFRGVIATSWTCTSTKAADFDGVFTPPETPLLTLMHANDPWFQSPLSKGSCANKISGRRNARHVAVPGTGHGTFDDPGARAAVLEFLERNAASP